jgi:hypothetical protein
MSFDRAFGKYKDASQAIYEAWLSGNSNEVLSPFQMDYLPEPYLDYGFADGKDACVFLATNPGEAMPHQLRSGVAAEFGGGTLPTEYRFLSVALAEFYGDPARFQKRSRYNVRRMKELAKTLCGGGTLQVELFPWHSTNLPKKAQVMKKLRSSSPLYGAYHLALKEFLATVPAVFSWNAGTPSARPGDGIALKADAMGLDFGSARSLPLRWGRTGVSQELRWQRTSGGVRGIFVNQGSATVPADTRMENGTGKFEAIRAAIRS